MTSLSPTSAAPRFGAVRLLSGPVTMFMLCFCGMAIGLAIDLQSVLPATIVSLCTGSHSLVASVVLHSALLPATNFLTLASGFAAIGVMGVPTADRRGNRTRVGARVGFYAGCNLAMLAGMFLAEWLGPLAAARIGLPWSLSAMTAAMATGMVFGMMAWTGGHRLARAVAAWRS